MNSFFRPTVPQLRVEVDREKALALGVPVPEVFAALQAQLGSLSVNDFNKSGRTYRVVMQADARFRVKPEDIGNLHVRSTSSGQMIPLKALVTVASLIGPEQIERYNGLVAAKVLGGAKPGFSSGESLAAVEQVAREVLPPGYSIEWTAQAFQEKRTGNASVFAFGFAMLMVYLILVALYERWGVPLAVLLAVPFAVTGALLAVFLRMMENDIYFQIGLVVLIGLAAKNAILIAELAMQGMAAGKSAAEAAREAARLRFRPIVMTSLAFVLGVVPLVIATGAGAAARQSMGTGVFGGMLVATFIAPIFVRDSRRCKRRAWHRRQLVDAVRRCRTVAPRRAGAGRQQRHRPGGGTRAAGPGGRARSRRRAAARGRRGRQREPRPRVVCGAGSGVGQHPRRSLDVLRDRLLGPPAACHRGSAGATAGQRL